MAGRLLDLLRELSAILQVDPNRSTGDFGYTRQVGVQDNAGARLIRLRCIAITVSLCQRGLCTEL